MMYIKKLNFCFIRIPKNASSSIMNFMQANAGSEEDTFSRVFKLEGKILSKGYGQNFSKIHNSHSDVSYVINHKLVPDTAKFVGVVRDPFDRQLSLYLYRMKDQSAIAPSPEHFKQSITNGILQDLPHHMQLQSTYLNYSKAINHQYWLFENIHNHIDEWCKEYNIVPTTPLIDLSRFSVDTLSLIDTYYDDELRSEVTKAWKPDIDLYNKLKSKYPIGEKQCTY